MKWICLTLKFFVMRRSRRSYRYGKRRVRVRRRRVRRIRGYRVSRGGIRL